MSRIKMLLDVIEDVRSLGDSLQALADAMASGEPKEEPKKKTRTKAEPKPKAQEPAPAEAEPEKKPLTLEEVRMVLAENPVRDIRRRSRASSHSMGRIGCRMLIRRSMKPCFRKRRCWGMAGQTDLAPA